MYTHQKQIIQSGAAARLADKAIVLLHGRGGSAGDMISLARHLNLDGAAIYAPQATNHSWYPYSFLSPENTNQPSLDSAISLLDDTMEMILADGFHQEQIYFAGFSQGACLTLEYTSRNAARYGGVVAFTGGLIGAELIPARYKGNFSHTPVLITTSNPDPHVPLSRVEESVKIIDGLGAEINLKIFDGKPHSISTEELKLANDMIFINN